MTLHSKVSVEEILPTAKDFKTRFGAKVRRPGLNDECWTVRAWEEKLGRSDLPEDKEVLREIARQFRARLKKEGLLDKPATEAPTPIEVSKEDEKEPVSPDLTAQEETSEAKNTNEHPTVIESKAVEYDGTPTPISKLSGPPSMLVRMLEDVSSFSDYGPVRDLHPEMVVVLPIPIAQALIDIKKAVDASLIPHQLRTDKTRFILVRRVGEKFTTNIKGVLTLIESDGKRPAQTGWTNNPSHQYRFDSSILLQYIADGGNYGVVLGEQSGGLIVPDADVQPLIDLVEKEFSDTLLVRTGRGGLHPYIMCPELKEKVVLERLEKPGDKEKTHYGEIQSNGQFIVGPGCSNTSGDYRSEKDLPIKTMTKEDILSKLGQFIPIKKVNTLDDVGKDATRKERKSIKDLKYSDIIDLGKLHHVGGDSYQGPHPQHGSENGMNFRIDGPLWTCYHHYGHGGDAIQLYAVIKGILGCGECGHGALKGEKFLKVKKLLYDDGLIDEDVEPREKAIASPGYVMSDGTMVEECWDGKEAYYYVRHPDGSLEKVSEFEDTDRDVKLVPIVDEMVRLGQVKLPSHPTEYESEAELFQDIKDFLSYWADVNHVDIETQALWSMMTALYQLFPQLVINAIRAASESGKTRLGEAVRHIDYRGLRASGTLTYSSMFRTAQKWGGTMLINEADMKGSDETNKIIKWLNESVDPNGAVWVTNPNTLEVECFRAFCPVILVSRQRFQDDALESRCHVTTMEETTRKDVPLNLPPEFYTQAENLRNQLLMFRFKNYHKFVNDYELRYEGIGSRLNQIIQPLASLAKIVSPEMYEQIGEIVKACQAWLVADRAESLDGLVVRTYFMLTADSQNTTSTEIAAKVKELSQYDISAKKVGSRLKSLPFEKYEAKDGKSKPWRVKKDKVALLMRKYVPEEEREAIKNAIEQGKIDGYGEGGMSSELDTLDTLDTLHPEGGKNNRETLWKNTKAIKEVIDGGTSTDSSFITQMPELVPIFARLRRNGRIGAKPNGILYWR